VHSVLSKSTRSVVVEAICKGSPRQMGLAQGLAAKNKIRTARLALAELEAFRLQRPWWLPYGLHRWLSEQKASRFLAAPLAEAYPDMKERAVGIAEGAGVNLSSVLLFNALEPLLSSVAGCTACPGACSALAVRGRRSATGEPILVRNFDYLPLVQPFYMVRDSRPEGRLRALEFTIAPLAGVVDGMNEAGLCITYNYAFTMDDPKAPAAPISMAIAECLQRSRTVTEAADFISSRQRWGGALLMLVDAGGDIASLELSSTRSHLRRSAEVEDALFHTNAFSHSHMREVQVPWEAHYTNDAPTPLRGRRLHQSSESRDERFRQILSESDVFDIERLGTIMADHGSDGTPSDDTLCMHGSYWFTTACLQFYPKTRRMRIAYNTACEAVFDEVEF